MKKKIIVFLLVFILIIGNCMVVFGANSTKKIRKKSNDGSSWETYSILDNGNDGDRDNMDNTNYGSQEVTATYNDAGTSTSVYSVDIVWGELDFTYTVTQWSAKDKKYVGTWDHTTKDLTNTITVTNNSNKKVKPIFAINDNELLPNGVTLKINKDANVIASATKTSLGNSDVGEEVATAADGSSTGAALQREAYVTLSGDPTSTFTAGKVASITVSINTVP